MSDYHTVRCDVCGRLREEANHWFRVTQTGTTLVVTPAETDWPTYLSIAKNQNENVLGSGNSVELMDVCGQSCLSKVIDGAYAREGQPALTKS